MGELRRTGKALQAAEFAEPGFVGRREELAAIAAAAAAAVESRPRVVWISGEAGTGKTQLLRKALRDLPAGFLVVEAEADELAHDVAFDLAGQLGVGQVTAAFPAGLALLERWSRLQTDGPVAVAVEDLHWADPDSPRRPAGGGPTARPGQGAHFGDQPTRVRPGRRLGTATAGS